MPNSLHLIKALTPQNAMEFQILAFFHSQVTSLLLSVQTSK